MEKEFSKRLEEKSRAMLDQKNKHLIVAGKKIVVNKPKSIDEMTRFELIETINGQKNELNFLSDVFLHMPYAVLILNEKNIIVYANDLSNSLLSQVGKGLINMSFFSFLANQQDIDIWESEDCKEVELSIRCSPSEFKICKIKKVKNEKEELKEKKYFVFINDISIENQKKKVQHQIENVSLLSDIASGIAHELRNPLAGVKLNADTLEEYLTDSNFKEFTKRISKEIDRANDLLKLFFKYAHPVKAIKAFVSAELLITSAQQTIQTLYNSKMIKFIVLSDTLLPHVYVDFNQVEQILYHLFKNAVEAQNEKSGLIEVILSLRNTSLNNKQECVEFRIKNTGDEIALENQKKLFLPFFTTKVARVGLGLATSKRLALENGGDLSLFSSNPQETIFILLLPTA